MKKKFSIRELILFGVFVCLLAYYLAVQGPIKKQTEELEQERLTIETQIAAYQPKLNEMHYYEEELDKIYKKYDGNPVSIPNYPNINNVISEMSVIFDGDSTYSIHFSDAAISDCIVSRNIKITFTCYSYSEMVNKIDKINSSTNKYKITDLDINYNSGNQYSVNLSMVEYEYSASNTL